MSSLYTQPVLMPDAHEGTRYLSDTSRLQVSISTDVDVSRARSSEAAKQQ